MPPIFTFTGASPATLYANPGLTISGPFTVGHPTSITISITNTGAAGNAIIHLWWVGPTLTNGVAPTLDSGERQQARSSLRCDPPHSIWCGWRRNGSRHGLVDAEPRGLPEVDSGHVRARLPVRAGGDTGAAAGLRRRHHGTHLLEPRLLALCATNHPHRDVD